MERARIRNYGKIYKILFTAVLLCGLLHMGMVGSPVSAAEKVTLYGLLERYPFAEVLWGAANKEYTGAKLEAEMLPRKTKADKLRILWSGKSPDMDITLVNQDEVAEYEPFLEPLNGYMKKYWNEYKFGDIDPGIMDKMKIGDNIYAIPYDMNTCLMYYRKDLFDEAGFSVPKTIDEWLNMVKKLTTNGQKGVVLQLMRPVSTHIGWAYYLWSLGGDYFDEKWNPIFNSERGIESLEVMGEFYKYAPKECLNWWADEMTNSLNQGVAVTGLNWISRCAKMDDPKMSKVVGKIHFAVPPGQPPHKGTAFNAVGGWAISKFSKNKEEAFKLIALLSGEEYATRFAASGMSPRHAVVYNPELVKKYRWYPAALESVRQGKTLPNFPEFWEVADEIAIQIHHYLMGKVSAKEALDVAAEKTRVIMKEKGYMKE